MMTINKAKYLSLIVLLGAWGCTTNQYVSRSGDGYDDLYGGSPGAGVISTDRGTAQDLSRSDNPDYAYTGNYDQEGTSDYYDESYISSKSLQRVVSNDVGYNAGFVDGYNQANRFANPYGYGGYGSYWPGSSMNIGFQFGMGSMFRMRPYLGFGMGSMMGMGYSPFGYGSMMGYGYDPFGYSPFGYSPFGFNSMYGYGYGGGYYDSFYGGGYGYNPWAYSRPVIVVNNNYERQGLSRTYGPRVVANGNSSRSNDRYNSNFVNSSRSAGSAVNERSSRRGANAVSGSDTYASPRSSRSYNGSGVTSTGGRTGTESYSSSRGGASEGNNVYYSRPRSASSSNYSSGNVNSGNISTRSSRGDGVSNSPSYSVPSRSQSDYSAPSRSTYTPSRSSESFSQPTRTYSQPARTYSQPSYSAPSRSYSAPSGGGGGGGATRSSSRGPR